MLALSVVGPPGDDLPAPPHPSASSPTATPASSTSPARATPTRSSAATDGAALARSDAPLPDLAARPLVPTVSRYHPGSLYLHDLALIDGVLHGNAVGAEARSCGSTPTAASSASGGRARSSATARPTSPQPPPGQLDRGRPDARAVVLLGLSAERVSARRPGHRNWAVDGRGVIFDGATREVSARGLTRPHSARLHGGRVWVDDSGYGRLGVAADGRSSPLLQLDGWTRGLTFCGDVAFVGISRVIPRFRQYAPGLDVDRSSCGVVAVGSPAAASWRASGPAGNQVFALDGSPAPPPAASPSTRPAAVAAPEASLLRLPDHKERRMSRARLVCWARCTRRREPTHRFLDGHPQMHVYPFESQPGTRRQRWLWRPSGQVPLARVRARRDTGAGLPQSSTKRARCARARLRQQVPRLPVRARRRGARGDLRADRARDRPLAGQQRVGLLRRDLRGGRNVKRTGREEVYVGYGPIIGVDGGKILDDLPDAHVLHVGATARGRRAPQEAPVPAPLAG